MAKVSIEVEFDGVGRERKCCEELSSTDTMSEGKVAVKALVDLLLRNKVMETRKEERKKEKSGRETIYQLQEQGLYKQRKAKIQWQARFFWQVLLAVSRVSV